MNNSIIKEVLEFWDITYKETQNYSIPGSPERASDRFVVLDNRHKKYLVEKHHFWNMDRKEKIAQNIETVSVSGFKWCQPYLVSKNGKNVEEIKNRCWMVQPFIESDPLKRPDYLDNSEMGRNCAQKTALIKQIDPGKIRETVDSFDLKDHTLKLIDKIGDPRFFNRDVSEVVKVITQRFIPALNKNKLVFSHGDLHPVNILWENNDIKTIIDWEFSGIRYEFTDVANLVGCLGFENPSAFNRGFYKSFIKELEDTDYFSEKLRKDLFLYVFGFRFCAWLNEWLKKNETEMVELELDYLEILLNKFN